VGVAHKRLVKVAEGLGKEKTQFFEKLALGSGATIAALVSFLGARKDALSPRWLLRSSIVSLALVILLSLYRNWRYQFYALRSSRREYFAALQREQRTRDEMF
jgi:hypothetical protein